MADPIKVFLVEDSQVALQILKKLLDSAPEVQVVGTANDGAEALAKIPGANPDVICTDLQMPVMDGFDFTQKVMAQFPRPILVVAMPCSPVILTISTNSCNLELWTSSPSQPRVHPRTTKP